MKKRNKLLITIVLFVIIVSLYLIFFGRYNGIKPGNIGNKYGEEDRISISEVIKNARDLKGVVYDFSMGSLRNKLSDYGLIVCADLIDIAFSKSGYPLETKMREDFELNKVKYNNENGINGINTKYFYRRSRNIKQFCINKGYYIEKCSNPLPGDIIFYGDYHVALVTSPLMNGYIKQIEALPNQIVVMELKKKWNNNSVGRIGICF